MAERFWPGINPVGQNFKRDDVKRPLEIVGVVRNCRIEDLYSPISPAFYIPISQEYKSAQTLQVRTFGQPQAMAGEISALARKLAPTAPVLSVRTMSDAVRNGANGLSLFNLGAKITAVFGFLGLTLAVVGIYGVMAYAVGQRTQEIGVHMALGAQRRTILWMVSRQGLAIIGTGLSIGLLTAIAAGHLVGEFLVGIGPTDPVTYITVSILLSFIALAACYIPLGNYIAYVFTTDKDWRVERFIFKLLGVDRNADQKWSIYVRSILAFSAVSVLFLYTLQRLQHYLPLNEHMTNVPAPLAWNTAVSASPTGTIACVATWYTDFRADLPKIDIPVLVLHGTADRILPIEACGPRSHELIKNSQYVPIEGASHGLCWTHAEEVNEQLLRFFA